MKRARVNEPDLPEAIAAELRSLITLGAFRAGLKLRQFELARHFGASRVALREALSLLTAEGIVEHSPNRGFFVAILSAEEARQLYLARRLLEAELLRTVQWPSKQQLAALRAMLAKADRALRDRDTAGWLLHHRQFFAALFDLSPEKVLAREALRLIRLTDRYRALAPQVLRGAERRATQERHLLDLLASRDRRRLLSVFARDRKHIEQGVHGVLRARGL